MSNDQRFLDPNTEPPRGWRYTDADTKFTIKALSLSLLIQTARAHRVANGLPIPENFAQVVETALCRLMPPKTCVYLDGRGYGGSLCVHRGEFIRYVVCESCGGSVKGKVQACAIHGECTAFEKEIGVRQCGTCPDRLDPDRTD